MRVYAVLLLIVLSEPLLPQEPPVGKIYDAGGKWRYHIEEDKLTGALFGIYELIANERIGSEFPSFIIMCGGTTKAPKWINSKLTSPVVLGRADFTSGLGAPQQMVHLRRAENQDPRSFLEHGRRLPHFLC
jgi:hypothetical protein